MKKDFRLGLSYGLAAYLLWGVLPIYWKQIQQVPALEILANRFIWSLIFMTLLIKLLHKQVDVRQEIRGVFSGGRSTVFMLAAAVMIAFNWGIFIWAVEDGRIMATSMGYYINPMLNVMLGLIFLREKLNRLEWLAVGFACTGIAFMVVRTGYLPWVSLCIASTFAFYGLLKKYLQVSPFTSIFLETLIISPLAVGYLVYLALHGGNAYQLAELGTKFYLMGSGAATAVPLLLFTAAAKLLPLNTVGFLQYISPTISMFIGIFIYGESFTSTHAISFGCIWIGLVLFSFSQFKNV